MPSNDAHFSGEGHLIEAQIEGDVNKTIIPVVCDSSGHLLVDAGTGTLGTVKIEDTAGNPITTTAGSLNVNITSAPSGTQNVLVTNGAGASAVNIQDGGNSITVDGTVAVSNFPATQPVSGTVTVIQPTGTNLHTVLDSGTLTSITNALPAGSNVIGHVIADSGSTTVVTGNVTVVQPTGTNLHTVIDSGTTTVTQATGTNLHVVVDSAPSTVVTQGTSPWVTQASATTAVTILTTGITASSNGDNTVIAAVGGKKITVFAWNLSFSGTVNAKFTDGAGGTLLSGLYYGIVNAGGGNSVSPPNFLWQGSTNTALVLNLSGATAVGGSVSYYTV